MRSSLTSASDSLLEDTIGSILTHLGYKEERYPAKYVSRDHTSGNLIFPCPVTLSQSSLDSILENSSDRKFSIDNVKFDSEMKVLKVLLNQNSAFRTSVQTVLDSQKAYGANFPCQPKLQFPDLNHTFQESEQLSLYRLFLCSIVLRRFLRFVGCGNTGSLESDVKQTSCQGQKNISVCNNRARVQRCSQTTHLVCVTEIHQLNGAKNLDMSYKGYKILREKDVRRNEEYANDESSKISRIVDACITFDLLTTKLNMPVCLNLSEERVISRNSSTKGAVFVLYTYARLVAIVDKFEEFLRETTLEVPTISETDFSILTSSDEKVILYNYILMFPVLVKEIWSELINREEFHVNKICLFLAQFSSTISKYYRSTRVLMTGTPHLFPLMFARIYLLKAALQVLQNGLNCLNIEPLSEM